MSSSDEGLVIEDTKEEIDDGFIDASCHSGWANYVVADFLQQCENPCKYVDKFLMMDYIDSVRFSNGHGFRLEEFTNNLHDWLYCKAFFEQCNGDYMKEVHSRMVEIDKAVTCDCIEGNRRYNEWYDKEVKNLPRNAMMAVAERWLDSQIDKNNISPVRRPFIWRILTDQFTPQHFEAVKIITFNPGEDLDVTEEAEEDEDDLKWREEYIAACAEACPAADVALEVENAEFLKNVMTYTAPEEIEIRVSELEDVMDDRKVIEALLHTAEVLPQAYLAYCNYRDDFVQTMVKNPHHMQHVMVAMLRGSYLDVSDMQFYFDRVEYCLTAVPAFDEQQRQLTKVAREFLEEIFGKPISTSLHEIKMKQMDKRQREDYEEMTPAKRIKSDDVFENICKDLNISPQSPGDELHKDLAFLMREFQAVKPALQPLTRETIDEQLELMKFLLTLNQLTKRHITYTSNILKQAIHIHDWIVKHYIGDEYKRFWQMTTMPKLE